MLEAAIWLAASVALVSAIEGDRAAIALLASFVLCVALEVAGLRFAFIFWLMIDLSVALAIIHRTMTFRDVAIIGLFMPAWALYLAPPDVRYVGVSLVLIAQFLLTRPLPARFVRHFRRAAPTDDHMRMLRHA